MEPPSRSRRKPRRLQTAPTTRITRRSGKGCCYTSSRSCLPADIVLFEILPWLTVRTILKLKCVCRDWYRLLSGSDVESHHRLAVKQFERSLRHPSPAVSGTIHISPGGNKFQYYGFDGTFLNLPVHINLSSSAGIYIKNIVTSTNGLCCLFCLRNHPGHVSISKVSTPFIYICNPFTGKSGEEVPLNHRDSLGMLAPYPMGLGSKVRAFALAFEPSEVHYKLVNFECICSTRVVPDGHIDKCEFRFSLYSSGSGRWVESGSKLTIVSRVIESFVAFHWRTFYGEGKVYWDCYTFAVQYDIGRDAASHVEMPEFDSKCTYLLDQQLELREGRLRCTRLSKPGNFLEVWVLLGDGGNKEWRWERKERVGIRILLGKDPTTFSCCPDGAIVYEDEDRRLCAQMIYISHGLNSGLVHYNIRDKKVVCARIYRNRWYWELIEALIYRHHESLHDVPRRAMFLNQSAYEL